MSTQAEAARRTRRGSIGSARRGQVDDNARAGWAARFEQEPAGETLGCKPTEREAKAAIQVRALATGSGVAARSVDSLDYFARYSGSVIRNRDRASVGGRITAHIDSSTGRRVTNRIGNKIRHYSPNDSRIKSFDLCGFDTAIEKTVLGLSGVLGELTHTFGYLASKIERLNLDRHLTTRHARNGQHVVDNLENVRTRIFDEPKLFARWHLDIRSPPQTDACGRHHRRNGTTDIVNHHAKEFFFTRLLFVARRQGRRGLLGSTSVRIGERFLDKPSVDVRVDRQLDIQHDHCGERIDRFGYPLPVIEMIKKLAIEYCELSHVGADVPFRLQADTRVRHAHVEAGIEVIGVKLSGSKTDQMAALRRFETGDQLRVLKKRPRLVERVQVLIEALDKLVCDFFYETRKAAQMGSPFLVESKKRKPRIPLSLPHTDQLGKRNSTHNRFFAAVRDAVNIQTRNLQLLGLCAAMQRPEVRST